MRPGRWLVAILFPIVVFGCGRGPAPTEPSPAPLFSSIASDRSSQTPVTATWACLTQAMGCGSRFSASSRDVSAAAPTAPLMLAGSASGSTVTLTWGAPTGADAASSYVIEAGSASGLTNLASFDTGTTATTFSTTGVPAGTYFVRVRARNASGTSAASNEVTITVGSSCAAPGVTTLTGSVSGSSIALTWTAGANASSYVLEAGTSPGASNAASFDTGTAATTFSASGVGAGTYYVRVKTKNACGTSAASNEVTLVVGGSTGAVTMTGRWIGVSPDGLVISDPSSCDAGQDLQMDLTQSGSTFSGTVTSRTNKLTPGANCGTIGFTDTVAISGTISGSTASFQVTLERGRGTVTWSGTVSGNRWSGTIVGYPATFAVTKQ